MQQYSHDPAKANALLDEAGWKRASDGTRFRLAMKTSTDESSRLLAMILQQQLRDVGIALEVRSFEFATFYSDITKGAFQMYTLRWLGGNEDPDIFRYAYDSPTFPPHGANRGHYANSELDTLIKEAGRSGDQAQRRKDYGESAADSCRRVAVDQLVVSGCGPGPHQKARKHSDIGFWKLRFFARSNHRGVN